MKMPFEQLNVAFAFIFSPLFVLKPHVSLLLISTLLTVIIIALNKLLVNKKIIKEIKDKIAEMRENLTQAQKNGKVDEANKYLNEMLRLNNEYMRHSFKTLIASLIVISMFLPWMQYKYQGLVVFTPFSLPVINSKLSWILWYILVSFTIGWILRKVLEVE